MHKRFPKLFFSHSEKDKNLLQHLVEAARIGLDLNKGDIVCSSLDGYHIQSGKDIIEISKQGGAYSNCLIGVITPNSLNSHWVLFELGARWGTDNPFVIILANGADFHDLPEAIRTRVAKKCTESELELLFNDVAEQLKIQFHSPSVRSHLKKAEVLSQAESQRRFDIAKNKSRAIMKLNDFSADVEFICPKENDIITGTGEYSFEIKLESKPKENNSLWLCHEVSGHIWPKQKLTFIKNVAEGTEIEGGTPPNGAWNLIVIEVDEEGENQINKWFEEAKFSGIKQIHGALVGDLKLILMKRS
jgi:hypothetical protein